MDQVNGSVFEYTVSQGHNSDDLDYVATSSLALNSGSILDRAGNAGVLTLGAPGLRPLAGNKDLIIDTALPAAVSVTSTIDDGTYRVGQSIGITVTLMKLFQ